VLSQSADNFCPAAIHDIFAKFLERDMNHVMVMKFERRDFVAKFEPEAME
jgi:hypothetical protein